MVFKALNPNSSLSMKNALALRVFGKPYDALTTSQKWELHTPPRMRNLQEEYTTGALRDL
jgi:hypothetical protein